MLPAPLAATLAAAGGTAPVTLLVAGNGAVASGWAPRAAVALAEAWSRDGTRLVLADLSQGAAALDEVVGEPNDEGLADVFFYGASLKRVIRTSTTRGFGFIPAGIAPVESRDLLTDAGWRQVIAYFFREGAALLVYLPGSVEGLADLAGRLGAVIALAAPGDLEQLESVLPAEAAVLAAIAPPAAAPAEAPPAPVEAPAAAGLFAPAEPATAPAMEPSLPEAAAADAESILMPVGMAAPPAVPAEDARFAPPPGPAVPVEPEAAPPPSAAVPVAPELAPTPSAAAPEAIPAPPAEEAQWAPPQVQLEPVVPQRFEPAEESRAERVGAAAEARGGVVDQRDERKQRPRLPEDPREALVEALWARRAGGPGRAGLAPPVDPVPGRKVTDRDLLTEPPTLVPEPEPHRWGLGLALWLLLGAAVAVGAVFAWQAYRNGQLPIPGVQRLVPREDGAAGAATTPAAVPAPAPVAATADSLPYSVAIEAYPEYAQAMARANTLARENVDVGFFVTPMLQQGALWYHVMAGPVPDSAAGATLMQRLVDEGVKTGGSPFFDVVPTRLAFDLGDFPSRGEAEQRGTALAQKSIPTYVVEVPTGATSVWRLYAGAFQGMADAAVLRPALKAVGARDSLVLRIGRATR